MWKQERGEWVRVLWAHELRESLGGPYLCCYEGELDELPQWLYRCFHISL